MIRHEENEFSVIIQNRIPSQSRQGIGVPFKLPLGFAGFRIVHFMDDGLPVGNQLFNRR